MFRQMLSAAAFVAAIAVTPGFAQEVTDYLGVPGPISIDDVDYELAWSSNPQPGYYKQEYIRAGDRLESFQSMVLVEFLASDLTLEQVVSAQADMINQRKGTDPVANMALFSNPDAGEIMLDFLLSAKDEAGEFIIEWNGYRYAEAQRQGERGTLLFAISERAYGDDASESFLRGLGEFKAKRLLDLTTADLPEVQ